MFRLLSEVKKFEDIGPCLFTIDNCQEYKAALK